MEAANTGQKNRGTFAGSAADPNELMQIVNDIPIGKPLNYFSEETAVSLDGAMRRLGATWDVYDEWWYYDGELV